MCQKLYFYTCLEAYKYPRNGYTWDYTLKKVKQNLQKNYTDPSKIKIRLIGEETEEYCEQMKLLRKENDNVDLSSN